MLKTVVSLLSTKGIDEQEVMTMLPFVLEDVRLVTNQLFLTTNYIKGSVEVLVDNVIDVGKHDFFVGQTIEFIGSNVNHYIYTVKETTASTITVDQNIQVETFYGYVVNLNFSRVSPLIIANMIGYSKTNVGEGSPITSQSLSGGYSVSYETTSGGGYPPTIVNGLNSLKKLPNDRQDYLRYGYPIK